MRTGRCRYDYCVGWPQECRANGGGDGVGPGFRCSIRSEVLAFRCQRGGAGRTGAGQEPAPAKSEVAVTPSIAHHHASLPIAYRPRRCCAPQQSPCSRGDPLHDQAADYAGADSRGACVRGACVHAASCRWKRFRSDNSPDAAKKASPDRPVHRPHDGTRSSDPKCKRTGTSHEASRHRQPSQPGDGTMARPCITFVIWTCQIFDE
jgi:hypothetical protein